MDGHSGFRARLGAVERQQAHISRALDRLRPARFPRSAASRSELADAVAVLGEDVQRLRVRYLARDDMAECWRALAQLRERGDELFGECFALVQGAWARERLDDEGLHELADAYADELSARTHVPWQRFTVPAEADSYADLPQVIRLRFPNLGIWDLALVAHEFGHFAAERLDHVARSGYVRPRRNLGRELLDRAAGSEHAWALAHERFADAFAVYAGGPAYLAACVLLRFDAGGAHAIGFEHPPAAERVRLMDHVLRLMDAAKVGKARFGPRTDHLAALWAAALAEAGEPVELDEEREAEVTREARDIVDVLTTSRPRAAYRSFHRAQAMASALRRGDAPALREGDSIIDVVNAAWLARIDTLDDARDHTDDIAAPAYEACRTMLTATHAVT